MRGCLHSLARKRLERERISGGRVTLSRVRSRAPEGAVIFVHDTPRLALPFRVKPVVRLSQVPVDPDAEQPRREVEDGVADFVPTSRVLRTGANHAVSPRHDVLLDHLEDRGLGQDRC